MRPDRGEVWRYEPAVSRRGASTLRLVVSAAAINRADLPVVLALQVVATDPGGLLAVRVDPHGWASALSIEPTIRRRLAERVDVVDQVVMDQINAALRAAQDL